MKAKVTEETLELAYRSVEMRKELDALFAKYGGRLQLGWGGKWAYLQVAWDDNPELALTLMKVQKGGKMRYMTEAEEMLEESRKLDRR